MYWSRSFEFLSKFSICFNLKLLNSSIFLLFFSKVLFLLCYFINFKFWPRLLLSFVMTKLEYIPNTYDYIYILIRNKLSSNFYIRWKPFMEWKCIIVYFSEEQYYYLVYNLRIILLILFMLFYKKAITIYLLRYNQLNFVSDKASWKKNVSSLHHHHIVVSYVAPSARN